ncbi:helix-hairpin-helix domain-containing protein [Thermaerobacillus caldiproteolyticus]|uniref:Competence protein ComEA n=1 Tax=Thermaerobacillus caldiproteolyticus TaxID=247480 RepID=A0A7W0BXG4_9BACL|nr:helix-hairpin-helix domain-containing protein [Anoxybacillus caldiproteolyticus]MBA2873550.1 competence protein ComEA [Anoxybacillus caldiproteolyticus]
MWQTIKKYDKRWLLVMAVMLVAIVILMRSNEQKQDQAFSHVIDAPEEATYEENKEKQKETSIVFVDVKGAVVRPGVYEVTGTARIKDVIAMAGGFTKEADQAKVNLAAKIHDEMMIYVPTRGEENVSMAAAVNASASSETTKIDINTASLEEIQQLQGIGPTKAAAIIAYREEHGPFRKIEDLLKVTGIGEKSLEKMKEQIIIR